MSTLSDETLRETLAILEKHNGNQTAAAEELNLSRSATQTRIKAAYRRGLQGHIGGPNLVSPGFTVRGVSTLLGEGGEIRAQWVKTTAERDLDDTIVAIKDAFEDFDATALVPAAPIFTKDELLAVYPVADVHLGMYAWADETGADYDIGIAERLLTETVTTLIERTVPAETAIILNLGDFFHSDSNENRTRRSGNPLDVDTRYAKVLKSGVQLTIRLIQLALQKHRRVLYRALPGNHDPYAAIALAVALEAYFSSSQDRVTVDTSPSPYFYYKYGRVLIGATHGDMARAEDMPGIMAAQRAKDWGDTDYRYIYTGHLHSAKRKLVSENSGAQVEVFETIAPKDAWSSSMGFVSGRGMQSIVHHKEYGEDTRMTVNIKGSQ